MHALTLIAKRLDHLRNARRTRAAVIEQQTRKLRRLAIHAAARSPYWASVMDRHGIDPRRCRIEQFPILTKTEMMTHFDDFVTTPEVTARELWDFIDTTADLDTLFKGRYVVVLSSGTSGTPAIYCYDIASWMRGMAQTLRYNPFSWRPTRLAYYGRQGHFAGTRIVRTARIGMFRLFYRLEAIDTTVPVETVVDRLNRFRPTMLTGYPSAVSVLAEHQRSGALEIRPRLIALSGEPLTPRQDAEIQDAFGVRPRNLYQSSEHLLLGMDGLDFEGMYLMEDDLIFEFDEAGTLVTNLFNYTQPLVRYRSDDVLRPIDDRDGRLPFTKIAAVEGRRNHDLVFRTVDGVVETFSFHNVTTLTLRHVRKYQMVQTGTESFLFRIMLEDGLDDRGRAETLERARAALTRVLGENRMANVRFEIHPVDDIPVNPRTGKFELVVPMKGVSSDVQEKE